MLVRGEPDEPEPLSLFEPYWDYSEITLEATEPLEITLEGARLEQVSLRLRGPVTLRVTQTSSLVLVTIAGEASALGRPTVELDHATARDLTLGTTEAPFEGRVRVLRSELVLTQLAADDVTLESTTFERGLVQAESLNAADVRFDDLALDVEHGVISTTRGELLEVRGCGALALLDVEITRGRFEACKRLLRAYSTKLHRVIANGPIESDESSWQYSAFGIDDETELVSWASHIYGGAFCEGVRSTQLFASTVRCSDCSEDVFSSEGDVCAIGLRENTVTANYCETLPAPPEVISQCEEPLPVRTRPTGAVR
jgi:hypothetical protein